MRPRVQEAPEEPVTDLGPLRKAPAKPRGPEMRQEWRAIRDDEGRKPADEDDCRGDQRGARLGASSLRGLSAGFNIAAASELAVTVQAAMTGVRGGAVDVAVNLEYLNGDAGVMEMRRRAAEIERRAGEALAAAWPVLRDLAAGASA